MRVWEVDTGSRGSNVVLVTEIEGRLARCFAMVGKYLWVGFSYRDILVFDPSVCFFFFFSSHSLSGSYARER